MALTLTVTDKKFMWFYRFGLVFGPLVLVWLLFRGIDSWGDIELTFIVVMTTALCAAYTLSPIKDYEGTITGKDLKTWTRSHGFHRREYSYTISVDGMRHRLTVSDRVYAVAQPGQRVKLNYLVHDNRVVEITFFDHPQESMAILLDQVAKEKDSAAWKQRKGTMTAILVLLAMSAFFYVIASVARW